nr:hypothetical protein [Nocardia grenadensis]
MHLLDAVRLIQAQGDSGRVEYGVDLEDRQIRVTAAASPRGSDDLELPRERVQPTAALLPQRVADRPGTAVEYREIRAPETSAGEQRLCGIVDPPIDERAQSGDPPMRHGRGHDRFGEHLARSRHGGQLLGLFGAEQGFGYPLC